MAISIHLKYTKKWPNHSFIAAFLPTLILHGKNGTANTADQEIKQYGSKSIVLGKVTENTIFHTLNKYKNKQKNTLTLRYLLINLLKKLQKLMQENA